MSLLRIPDGEREPIYFESTVIVAIRKKGNGTIIWLQGDSDPWEVDCPINEVLSLIPERL